MIAFKALGAGGLAPITGYAWPLPAAGAPGRWVAGSPGDGLCRDAVHGCRVGDLPWWLQDELWVAEFDGPIATGRHKISGPRARLLRRVDAWDAACARRFAEACAERAADHGAAARRGARADTARAVEALAEDAARCAREGDAIVTAYVAAHVAARTGRPEAMTAEREWQAAWLRAELGLRG
jgi:hypothetical protein